MLRYLLLPAALALPAAAGAQITATLPVTCNTSGSNCVQAQPVVNPDGTALAAGGGGSATRTTAAGTSDTQAVPIQGVTGGIVVGVNNAQVGGAAIATNAGAATASTQRVILSSDSPLAPGAATSALQTTGNTSLTSLAGAVGSKATTASLSVNPATDTVFPEYQRPTALTAGGIVPATALNAVSLTAKASAGNFYGATLAASTVAGYLVVANLTAAPASGTALTAAQVLYCAPVAANGIVTAGGAGIPDTATVGITALFSTACATYTPVGTAALHIRIRAQ